MKRATLTMLIAGLVVSFMAPIAMSVVKKPPKSIFWEISSSGQPLDGYRLAIATKKSGMKIKSADGPIKLYFMQGAMYKPTSNQYYSVDGSGYWSPSEGRFEGNVDGQVNGVNITCNIYLEPGSHHIWCEESTNPGNTPFYYLYEIDCKQEIID